MENQRTQTYCETLAKMIRVRTISSENNPEPFQEFHALLRDLFPHVFSTAKVEDFDGSLLLCWKGKQEGKDPLLLMSHHDVVEAPGDWKYPPFDGVIAEGKLWGRGTLDTKGNLFAILQAADELIADGFVPDRDIYFESACNEEVDGSGADHITKVLKERGIHFYMTIDEGGMMLHEPIGGVDGTFALVGVGEKGTLDLKFTARSKGGHASTPGKNTPLVRLGRFMAKADDENLFEAQLPAVVEEMFRRMAPYAKEPMNILLENASKFKPALVKVMPKLSPDAGAMVQTTLAFTMAQGSAGRNVLPQEAWVIGNMRFSHHQGRKGSLHAIYELAKKYDIEMEVLTPGLTSRITDYTSEQFHLVEDTVTEFFPDVTPVPYIMNGASDSRFFDRVSDHCIRFAPFLIDHEQLASIHGLNENVDIETLAPAVDFYKKIIQKA